MAYTMPFWVVLFAWWLLRERPTVRHAAGIGLAAIGLVCFVEPWNGLGDIKPVLLDWAVDCAGAWARCCPSACSSATVPT